MRNYYKIFFLLFLALLSLQTQAGKFRSEAHGFAVNFPSEVEKSRVITEDGLVVNSFRSVIPKSIGTIVATGFMDPREMVDFDRFFNIMSRAIRRSGFITSKHTNTSFKGKRAVRFNITQDEVSGHGYAIIIDNDRYLWIIGMVLDRKDNSKIEPFLQSLEILEH